MQIKTMRYLFIPSRMATIKRQNVSYNVEKTRSSMSGNKNVFKLENSFSNSLLK